MSQVKFSPGRRRFLGWMGVSAALSGIGCTRQPREKILPYARAPEGMAPGKPRYYATCMLLQGEALGLLVRSETGRPVKIEGNPLHPSSLGATDAFAQASLYGLYDPGRSREISRRGEASTWEALCGELEKARGGWEGEAASGLRVLSGKITSPSLRASLAGLLARYPGAKWHAYEPLDAGNSLAGVREAFGRPVKAVYRFDKAEVIVSLDGDFLGCGGGRVRYQRDFADRRAGGGAMNRLYVAEAGVSVTGANADHRLALRPSGMPGLAAALAQALGLAAPEAQGAEAQGAFADGGEPERAGQWVAAAAADLGALRGKGLVVAGEAQPPQVHALAHAMNLALGNIGNTVYFIGEPDGPEAPLMDLVHDMRAGQVHTLLILDGNPAYTAPCDAQFAQALANVPFTVHCGLYRDETAAYCRWHVPAAHALESWGDALGHDGTATLMQPLIEPLYGGKTAPEVAAAFAGDYQAAGHDLLKEYWRAARKSPGVEFERDWRGALEAGLWADSAPSVVAVTAVATADLPLPAPPAGVDVVFQPDPSVHDGRFFENAWLQELPKPLSKLVWDNAAHMSPAMAAKWGLANGDEAEVEIRGRNLRVPVWIVPGHADGAVTLTLGYGRAWEDGTILGYDAYRLRRSDAPWHAPGAALRKTGRKWPLVETQSHQNMEGREPVKEAVWAAGGSGADLERERENPSLYPAYPYSGYAWGMAIDLSRCTGCSACVVACQAENNIPVVGKDQVMRGREMQWLRVDLYFKETSGESRALFQPLMCVHCENAPCELVCPVEATVHSSEGLNQMVYNRCIGTRYCSNNCPYKVRRFNFYAYAQNTPSLEPMRNPDVTVRSRGVMEKCTYCVQRIERARIGAEREGRPIRDGEADTACQQACPTRAIVFGDRNDPGSRVARLQVEPRRYDLLGELNTRPRTFYLARLRNPRASREAGHV
jgi:Fe-S-cluster-containing dehydrogenase component